MGIICVNPQVLVHGDENLHKDFKICICIAFGYEETKSIVVVLISLNLVGYVAPETTDFEVLFIPLKRSVLV